MSSRRIRASELDELLDLYAFLHPEDPVVDVGAASVQEHWRGILENPNLRYYVAEADRKIVSTCTLTVIPNLTRGLRRKASHWAGNCRWRKARFGFGESENTYGSSV